MVFCLSEIKNSTKLKNMTIFQISSSSWFQKCKNIWKKFIFWRNFAKKTCIKSHNLSNSLSKKVGCMSIWLCMSFENIHRFVLKSVFPNPATLKLQKDLASFSWLMPQKPVNFYGQILVSLLEHHKIRMFWLVINEKHSKFWILVMGWTMFEVRCSIVRSQK